MATLVPVVCEHGAKPRRLPVKVPEGATVYDPSCTTASGAMRPHPVTSS